MQAYLSISRVAQRLQKQVLGLTLRQARDRIYYQIHFAAQSTLDPAADVKKIGGRLYMTAEAAKKIIHGEII